MSEQPINIKYIKQEWNGEIPLLMRGWWVRHWWPARIKQLDRERADWERWCYESEVRCHELFTSSKEA